MTQALIAVDITASPYGIFIQYPTLPLHGEFKDPHVLLDRVDAALQNGLTWSMVVSAPEHDGTPDSDEQGRVSGALWYLAAKHGAVFAERPVPPVTDGFLRSLGLWRRGMAAANRAARLLIDVGEDE